MGRSTTVRTHLTNHVVAVTRRGTNYVQKRTTAATGHGVRLSRHDIARSTQRVVVQGYKHYGTTPRACVAAGGLNAYTNRNRQSKAHATPAEGKFSPRSATAPRPTTEIICFLPVHNGKGLVLSLAAAQWPGESAGSSKRAAGKGFRAARAARDETDEDGDGDEDGEWEDLDELCSDEEVE